MRVEDNHFDADAFRELVPRSRSLALVLECNSEAFESIPGVLTATAHALTSLCIECRGRRHCDDEYDDDMAWCVPEGDAIVSAVAATSRRLRRLVLNEIHFSDTGAQALAKVRSPGIPNRSLRVWPIVGHLG